DNLSDRIKLSQSSDPAGNSRVWRSRFNRRSSRSSSGTGQSARSPDAWIQETDSSGIEQEGVGKIVGDSSGGRSKSGGSAGRVILDRRRFAITFDRCPLRHRALTRECL